MMAVISFIERHPSLCFQKLFGYPFAAHPSIPIGVKKTDTRSARSTCHANIGEYNKISELRKFATLHMPTRALESRVCSVFVLCIAAAQRLDIFSLMLDISIVSSKRAWATHQGAE
jgi:hypothetical protein